MRANRAMYAVRTMCRVLDVSTSGYYAWLKRKPSARAESNASLLERITQIHAWSRGTYGVPRIHAQLRAEGVRVGRNRVARLMKEAGLQGISRRKRVFTTRRDHSACPAPNLVDRRFEADRPNQLWVADITYIPTSEGFLYLAAVIDVWSRKVVGWSMKDYLRTELVLHALGMALEQRKPSNVIHHSDHGCQYTSLAFGKRCLEENVRPSMGSVGDCYDNALCESFFATLECELIKGTTFKSRAHARAAIFDYIEGWYNPHRLHSALDYLSPNDFERRSCFIPSTPNR